jgi:hypothetical protein
VSQTAQTWLIVAATPGAAILGGILAYIAAAPQQRKQAARDAEGRREQYEREDRMRLEQGIAEILAAAQDILLGVQALRQAHARRTLPRYYLRIVAMLLRDLPVPEKWSDLVDPAKVRPLLATALEADRYQLDESRMLALDATTVLGPKLNRYFAVVALLTLGQDRKITTAIRELTPNVVALTQSFGAETLALAATSDRVTDPARHALLPARHLDHEAVRRRPRASSRTPPTCCPAPCHG